jgi:hypothetical protein
LEVWINNSTSEAIMHEVFEVLFQQLSIEDQLVILSEQNIDAEEIEDAMMRYPEYQ